MFQMLTRVIKWVSVPVVLCLAPFSVLAGSYELLLDFLICMAAIFFLQWAVWLEDYFLGAGLVATAVVFSPVTLPAKIFVLMSLAAIAAGLALLATLLRPQPVPTP